MVWGVFIAQQVLAGGELVSIVRHPLGLAGANFLSQNRAW